MAWNYTGGLGFNHLARIADPDNNGVAAHLYVEPPGESINPDLNLSDGRPGTAYRPDEAVFGYDAAAVDDTTPTDIEIAIDKNMVVNGECNDLTTGWLFSNYLDTAVVNGVVSGFGGRAGTQISLNSDTSMYQDITVRADEVINLSVALYNTAAKSYAILIEPNYSLNGSGVFVSGFGNWAAGSAGAWLVTTKTNVVVPSATVLGGPTATLRTWTYSQSIGYVDDLYIWPSTTFVGVFGHNVPLAALITVYSDTVDTFATEALKATLTPTVPSTGAVITLNHARYWHIYIGNAIAGVIDDGFARQPFIGELVLSQVTALPQTPTTPFEMKFKDAGQIRYETRTGAKWVFSNSPYPTREATLRFNTTAASDPQGWITRNFRAWSGGKYPVIIIPPAVGPAELQLPLYGTVSEEQTITWPSADTTFAQTEFTIIEDPSALF